MQKGLRYKCCICKNLFHRKETIPYSNYMGCSWICPTCFINRKGIDAAKKYLKKYETLYNLNKMPLSYRLSNLKRYIYKV